MRRNGRAEEFEIRRQVVAGCKVAVRHAKTRSHRSHRPASTLSKLTLHGNYDVRVIYGTLKTLSLSLFVDLDLSRADRENRVASRTIGSSRVRRLAFVSRFSRSIDFRILSPRMMMDRGLFRRGRQPSFLLYVLRVRPRDLLNSKVTKGRGGWLEPAACASRVGRLDR